MNVGRLRPSVTALAIGIALLATAGVAFADGDPASDYLISQDAFIPPDAKATTEETARLTGLLASSRKQGFPVKIAIIASRYDLGSVPILYGKPQTYAKFLASEDFYYWKTELVVVMPAGYGIYKAGGLPKGDRAAIDALAPPGSPKGSSLVAAAERALLALADRRGITLSAETPKRASASRERILIASTAAAALGAALLGGLLWKRRRSK